MKTAIVLLLSFHAFIASSQDAVNNAPALKKGIFYSHRSFENNKPSDAAYTLNQLVRVNRIDQAYNDTLYKLSAGGEMQKAFAVYDGNDLYLNTEDSLYRKADYIGRYPFVTISNKVHLEEGFVIVNKTPIFKEERDEVFTHIVFVNRQGDLVIAGFETVWALLKGDNDLSKPFGKEKHINETFKKYIVLMNERYPL